MRLGLVEQVVAAGFIVVLIVAIVVYHVLLDRRQRRRRSAAAVTALHLPSDAPADVRKSGEAGAAVASSAPAPAYRHPPAVRR